MSYNVLKGTFVESSFTA